MARSPRKKLPAAQPAARAPLCAQGRLPAPAKTPAGHSGLFPFLKPAKHGRKPTKTHQNQAKLTTFLFSQGRLMIKPELPKTRLNPLKPTKTK
jgi:hypothetical protein